MINELLQGILTDTLSLLSERRDFFSLSASEKETVLRDASFPSAIQQVILQLDETTCMEEVLLVRQFFQSGIAQGKFLQGFARFLNEELGHILDTGTLPSLSPALGRALGAIIGSVSYQEVAGIVYDFFERFGSHVPYVMVQSPFRLSLEMRDAIRQHFAKAQTYSFPLFSVNRNLIGGIRIFIDGETQDHSWIARLNALGNVLYSRV